MIKKIHHIILLLSLYIKTIYTYQFSYKNSQKWICGAQNKNGLKDRHEN